MTNTAAHTEAEAPSETVVNDHPWFTYYDAGVPHSQEYPEVPLYHWLDESAAQHPNSIACTYGNTNITYARLQRMAETLAANLRSRGVNPGDRVGLMMPNLPQTVVAFWGVLKAGAVVTMFNPLYMEKELVHQVGDSGLTHMITHDSCWPKFAKLRESLDIQCYYVTSTSEGFSFPRNVIERFKTRRSGHTVSVPFDGKHVIPFSALLKGRERLCHPIDSPREALALLQYTGGTTGLSKGAMLTHHNVASNTRQMGEFVNFLRDGSEQTFMGVLPFFHVYGLNTCLALPTYFHSRVIPVTRFVPLELLTSMKKFNATVLPGAPAMYIALLQQKNKGRFSLESLKVCISGSAPMPVETIRQFEEAFSTRIMEGYGLSEASPITHMTPAQGLRKVGSIGVPLPDTEAKIVDMELGTVELGPGKVGELVVRGPQVMTGYWNKADETAGTLRNGWLYTGDIASVDDEGYFSIVDRKKDMIIVAGYNVAPREIDEVLYEHPKVKEAVSVGVPHPSRGEVIKAFIVLKEGEQCERSEIVGWCRERLANYKVPRMVEFRDELPKTLVGKILRRVLRAEEEVRLKDTASDEALKEQDEQGEQGEQKNASEQTLPAENAGVSNSPEKLQSSDTTPPSEAEHSENSDGSTEK